MTKQTDPFAKYSEMIDSLPPILSFPAKKIIDSYQNQSSAVEVLRESFGLIEEVLALNTIIGIGLYCDPDIQDQLKDKNEDNKDKIDKQLALLIKPALGTWRGAFRQLCKSFTSIGLNPWKIDMRANLSHLEYIEFIEIVKCSIPIIQVPGRAAKVTLDQFLDIIVSIRNLDSHHRMTDAMRSAIYKSLSLAILQFIADIKLFQESFMFYISGRDQSETSQKLEYSGHMITDPSKSNPITSVHSSHIFPLREVCLVNRQTKEIQLANLYPLLDYDPGTNMSYIFRGYKNRLVNLFCSNPAEGHPAIKEIEISHQEITEIPIIGIFNQRDLLLQEFRNRLLKEYLHKESHRFQRKFSQTPYLPLHFTVTTEKDQADILSRFKAQNDIPEEIPEAQIPDILNVLLGKQNPGTLIVGGAGSGKTTLLSKAIDHLAAVHRDQLTHNNDQEIPIPILFELRHYDGRDLADWTRELACSGINPNREKDFDPIIQERIRQGKALLLLDGLDEIPNEHRETFFNKMAQLPKDVSACEIVVTSREVPFPDISILDRVQQVLLLGQLSKDQIETFLNHISLFANLNLSEISNQIGIESNRILELCRYPQGLVMLSSVFQENLTIDAPPHDLFSHFQCSIDNHRNHLIQSAQSDFMRRFLKDDHAFFYSHIQWAFQILSRKTYSVGQLEGERIMEKLCVELMQEGDNRESFRNELSSTLLNDVRLLEKTAGRYSFVLRSCADYFASCHFLEQFGSNGGQDILKVIEAEMKQSSLLEEPFQEAIIQQLKSMEDENDKLHLLTKTFAQYGWAKKILPRILPRITKSHLDAQGNLAKRVVDYYQANGDLETVKNCALEIMYPNPFLRIMHSKDVETAKFAVDSIYILLYRLALNQKYEDFAFLIHQLYKQLSLAGILKMKKRIMWLVMAIWRAYMALDQDDKAKEVIEDGLHEPLGRLYVLLRIFPMWIVRPVLKFARSRFNKVHSEGDFEHIFHVPNKQEYEEFKTALKFLGKVSEGMDQSIAVLRNFGEVVCGDTMWQLKRGLYGTLLYTMVHHDINYLNLHYFPSIMKVSFRDLTPQRQKQIDGVRDMVIRCFGYYAREMDIHVDNLNQFGEYYQLLNEMTNQQVTEHRPEFIEFYTMVGRPKNYLYAIGVLEAKVYGELFVIQRLMEEAKEKSDYPILKKCLFDLLPIGLDYPSPVLKCIQNTINFRDDGFILRSIGKTHLLTQGAVLDEEQKAFTVLNVLLKGLCVYHKESVENFVSSLQQNGNNPNLNEHMAAYTTTEIIRQVYAKPAKEGGKQKARFDSVEDIVFAYSDELKFSLFINQLITLNNDEAEDSFVRRLFHVFFNELLDYQKERKFRQLTTKDVYRIAKHSLGKIKDNVKAIVNSR